MKIYVASRASIPERSQMWREMRASGYPIVSTWIDEAGPGQTSDMSALWSRIENEIRSCSGLILYVERGDLPLKGAFVECGMAIAMGRPVAVVCREPEAYLGSWLKHPCVTVFGTIEAAYEWIVVKNIIGKNNG